jgi:hypothetical protein
MKWYLASRTRHTDKLKQIAALLESQGHIVNSDWIHINENLKPFTENLKRVQEIGERNIQMMVDSDIFLMFNDLTGVDIFTELGVCMGKNALGGNIRLYVVGDYDKASLMQYHTSVQHCKTLQEVFDLEKVDYANFSFPEFN